MPQFVHDEIAFYYQDRGHGIPFIFQHGLGASSEQPFGIFMQPPGIRLLSFDCRGHGKTHPLGSLDKIKLSVFADDLGALMDHLKLERAIIGGISMGAAVALNFTLRQKDRVLGLVLSRPAWLDAPNPWNVKMFSLVARLLTEHGPDEGKVRFMQTPEYLEAAQLYPDVARSLLNQFSNPRTRENAVNLEQIPRDRPNNDRREWANITVPTLVLANRQDPIHPFEYGQVIARTIPKAELAEITCKSVSLEQHNQDVQSCLEQFLTRNFPRRI